MAGSPLAYELSKFCKYSRQLRHTLKDTRSAFGDVERCGGFWDGDLQHSWREEEDYIQSVITRPPCLVILGQSCYAKASVVNELFGEAVLPTLQGSEVSPSWRMLRFKFGPSRTLRLTLPDSFELVDSLAAYEQDWTTVPRADLELHGEHRTDVALASAVVEVVLNHSLLKDGAEVVVSPSNILGLNTKQVFSKCTEDVLPVVLYAVNRERLSDQDVQELSDIRAGFPETPIFFIRTRDCEREQTTAEPTLLQQLSGMGFQVLQSNRHSGSSNTAQPSNRHSGSSNTAQPSNRHSGSSNTAPPSNRHSGLPGTPSSRRLPPSRLVEKFEQFPSLLLFVRAVLQTHLVRAACVLYSAHTRCLQLFIASAFDMARDIMITPRRIEYARARERELYDSLVAISDRKQDEIKNLIRETVTNIREELLADAASYSFIGVDLTDSGELLDSKQLRSCTSQIQDLVLNKLNTAVAGQLIGSVDCLRESFVGTLARCIQSLEKDGGDVEDCVASVHLKQVLNAAYQVEVTVHKSASLLRVLWEKMKQLVQALPWNAPKRVDADWKKKVASDMLGSLSESRLARSMCAQFKDRLCNSHEAFTSSLKQLEVQHCGRLERTEEQRMKLRKVYAPTLAHLALESTSLRDVILHGMPQLGREIGRGQYGVVYACDSWSGHSSLAVKSVVPPDEKHWNDLALEFHYTRSIPEHERIVMLRGSVIDHSYGGGCSPAVLLVMDRLQRDLYAAIKAGLDAVSRLQVALDVVEGMRYLHSQGLVHRDIKLKNVLVGTGGSGTGGVWDRGGLGRGLVQPGAGAQGHQAEERAGGYRGVWYRGVWYRGVWDRGSGTARGWCTGTSS
ncbi:DSTYK [Branchiostoma lanceolatum]|uniref:Dual serine/threonine and tyrosine protein kinase n=1 Tax=Branchiostoma lanceolatum TaxID=7740 RepID=A0A8J9ZY58_BRALA|nr:DSTYK [Branchiostoma lanceolatum]